MAMLKNITKILEGVKSDEDMDALTNFIVNEKLLHNSKVLPKRFLQAYVAIEMYYENDNRKLKKGKKKLLNALEKAFTLRSKDVELIPDGKSMGVIIDTSGSMVGEPLMGALAITCQMLALNENNSEESVVYAFATGVKKLDTYGLSPFAFLKKYFYVDSNYNSFAPNFDIGYGTEIVAALTAIFNNGVPLDYIFVLTDMEIYNTYYFNDKTFQKLYDRMMKKGFKSPDKFVFWNLEAYGHGTPMKLRDGNVMTLSGYSDKMIELLPMLFKGQTLVGEIESYEI
jgi:hypothetical protein